MQSIHDSWDLRFTCKVLGSNTVQFNGYHGCSKCKIKGVYNHEGHLVVFPLRDVIENKPQLSHTVVQPMMPKLQKYLMR